jgi:hypothetical protein
MQGKQVRITRNNNRRAGRQRQFEVFVVLCVPAVVDRHFRFEPNGRRGQTLQNLELPFFGQDAGEFRPLQHFLDFSEDRF